MKPRDLRSINWFGLGRRTFLRCAVAFGLALCSVAVTPCAGQPAHPSRPRVILASFDGLGYQIWTEDPAARELTVLRDVAAHGVAAEGIQPAFPSTTGNSHAALWTGAYGNANGISANAVPLLPRSAHDFLERRSGFRAEGLLAEPVWMSAARQGIRTMVDEASQSYPFPPLNAAPGAPGALLMVNGYQTRQVAPHSVLTERNVTWEEPSAWEPALPPASRAFRWTAGELTFHGALLPDPRQPGRYVSAYVTVDRKGPRVRVSAGALETDYDRVRPLARHFSDPLVVPASVPCATAFRLFDLSPDGARFFLYQAEVQEVALFDGSSTPGGEVAELLERQGPFIPNAAVDLYGKGFLGKPVFEGGDGTAERRYMETVELVARQFNRYTQALWTRHSPEFLVDYFPYPDEIDHTWLGLVRPGGAATEAQRDHLQAMRRWGYRLVDLRLAALRSFLGPADHLLVVSDHGMAAVSHAVNVNLALERAGLLARNPAGAIDASKSKAVAMRSCILLNTVDWKGGVVKLEDRKAVRAAVAEQLGRITGADGQSVFAAFYTPEDDAAAFGIGGPAGADLYYDLRPGYGEADHLNGPVVETLAHPVGAHGFMPRRSDMLAVLIGVGPRLPAGAKWPRMRSVDVAALVSDLLGIAPPRQAVGVSPLNKSAREGKPQ